MAYEPGVGEAREDLKEEIVVGDGRQEFGQTRCCRFMIISGFGMSLLVGSDDDPSLGFRLLKLKPSHRQQQYGILALKGKSKIIYAHTQYMDNFVSY